MKIIIISGFSATGKSELAKNLSEKFGFIYISKDKLKEKMFDIENHNTWDWKWYEKRALNELFDKAQTALRHRNNIVIESNFTKKDKTRILNLISNQHTVYEIHMNARNFQHFIRFVKRNETHNRHKGHHDRRWYFNEFIYSLVGIFGIVWPYGPLKLSDKLLEIDTTDFSNINYKEVYKFVEST